MVAFKFSVLGWRFQHAIDQIERSFEAASDAFYRDIYAVNNKAKAMEARVELGEASWIVEADGWQRDYADEFHEQIETSEESLAAIRKAFVLLAYHKWEKEAHYWFATKGNENGLALASLAKAAGLAVDPGLNDVRMLTNVLKHNSGRDGPDLFARRPELFDQSFDPTSVNPITQKLPSIISYEEGICLTDQQVKSIFAIIKSSGPQTHSSFARAK